MKNDVYFYVVYPFVNFELKGNIIFISINDYCDVLSYSEKFVMSLIKNW